MSTTETGFPGTLPADPDDNPAKPWKVRDEYGNMWLLFETLLRG